MMISLEMAKKLKKAGLVWEPQEGDWFYGRHTWDSSDPDIYRNDPFVFDRRNFDDDYYMENVLPVYNIFAPRLDQLLAEIEKRGYIWRIYKYGDGEVSLELDDVGWANKTAEEAAAEALLWILQGGEN